MSEPQRKIIELRHVPFQEWIVQAYADGRTDSPEFQSFVNLHGLPKIESILGEWLAVSIENKATDQPLFQAILKREGREKVKRIWEEALRARKAGQGGESREP